MEGVVYMRYIISGKNMNVSQSLKDNAIAKISKLEKYFTKENDARITMMVEKQGHIIEVTIPMKGTTIRAEESAENMYAAIDQVVDVLERQILKHKNKLIKRHRSHGTLQTDFLATYDEGTEETNQLKIVKSDKFADKPMDPQEACMEMDLLGEAFFVFRNSETDEMNVVYKIKEETYGLIEDPVL